MRKVSRETEDAKIGPEAYRNKTAPEWTGKE
jgi:hypothetical protein